MKIVKVEANTGSVYVAKNLQNRNGAIAQRIKRRQKKLAIFKVKPS